MVKKFIGVMSLSLIVATVAFADKLPPTLSAPKVAGETEVYDSSLRGYPGNVDWIVLAPDDYTNTVYAPFVTAVFGSPMATEYLYLYQVEGRTLGNNSFTIYVPLTAPPVTSGGIFTDSLDLDAVDSDAVHDSGNPDFPYLSGEHEVVGAALVQPNSFGTTYSPPVAWLFQWTWNPGNTLDTNEESYVLFIRSPAPPIYGYATLKDTYSGNTYKIPVPSPEPTSFVLLLMGLGVSGAILRRGKK